MAMRKKRWSAVVLLGALTFLVAGTGCVSNQTGAAGTAKVESNSQSVKGKIQQVADGVLVVVPPKGERVSVKYSSQTPVKGGTLAELVKSQPVRIFYTVKGGQNNATSIEVLPQGSCGGS